jgi:epoxide hydrolase 4
LIYTALSVNAGQNP